MEAVTTVVVIVVVVMAVAEALLVAVNNVEASKTFDCELWKKEYVNQPNIYNMIKCGDTGSTIMN